MRPYTNIGALPLIDTPIKEENESFKNQLSTAYVLEVNDELYRFTRPGQKAASNCWITEKTLTKIQDTVKNSGLYHYPEAILDYVHGVLAVLLNWSDGTPFANCVKIKMKKEVICYKGIIGKQDFTASAAVKAAISREFAAGGFEQILIPSFNKNYSKADGPNPFVDAYLFFEEVERKDALELLGGPRAKEMAAKRQQVNDNLLANKKMLLN